MTQGYHDEHLLHYVLPAMPSTALLSQVIGLLAKELLHCPDGRVLVCSFSLLPCGSQMHPSHADILTNSCIPSSSSKMLVYTFLGLWKLDNHHF